MRWTSNGSCSSAGTIRCVLFDAVGTLIFADPSAPEVYHSAGRRHGSHLSIEEISQRFVAALPRHHLPGDTHEAAERERWQKLVAEVFYDVPDADVCLFPELWDHFARPASWRTFDDVRPVWDELKRRGVTIGIASNFDARLETLCTGLTPLSEASHIFYSSQIGYAKPHREFFQHIQRRLECDPAEILFIGDDAEKDLAGATAAGMQARLIDRKAAVHEGHVIATLDAILEMRF